MSNNRNKNGAKVNNKPNSAPANVKEEQSAKSSNLPLKITAISLVAVFALVIIVGAVLAIANRQIRLDYGKDNVSKYVSISKEDYTGFEAKINIPEPSERELNDAIISVLYKNREATDDNDYINLTISAGDVANIYYRGYTLNDDGSKNYFDGGCNFNSTYTSLEIGSGSFVSGFEYGLIGKNQKKQATMTKVTEGLVKATDIVLVTYSVTYADGTSAKSQSAIIDLTDPNLDKKWGVGFSEYWKTKEITVGSETKHTIEVETTKESTEVKKDVYSDVSVSEIYRINVSEERPLLVIEAKFPHNYSEESLQNKIAYFETFIVSARDYTVPELNEEFITKTLGISKESLDKYEGADTVEKYKNSLMAQLKEDYLASVEDAVAMKFWEYITTVAKYKKLPKGDVKDYYDSMYSEMEASFAQYKQYYGDQGMSLDAFARSYMGLSSSENWEDVLYADAEETVKQKLAFYYIIEKEGYTPTDAEYQAVYQKMFDDQVEAYLEWKKVDKTDENYEEKLEEAKAEISEMYSEEYWNTQVTYKYGMSKICEKLADVKNEAITEK